MKKMMIGLMVGTLMATTSMGVLAAPGGPKRPGPAPAPAPKKPGYEQKHNSPRQDQRDRKDRELKADAGYVINRTAQVMKEAQQIGQRNGRYTGFALATAHQQKARELYYRGSYREAINFSLRARDLALQIITKNNRRIRAEHRRDDREERYYDRRNDTTLDARLDQKKIGRDRDAIRIKIELNL